MSLNGRLARPGLLGMARITMRSDLYQTAQVYRRQGGRDVFITAFQTRIAALTASGEQGRDTQKVQSDAADRMYVALCGQYVDVKKSDELWVGEARYRMVASDIYPHARQLILKSIQ